MKEKIILSVTILLASIILGGFYYATQISKQKSIEKQQQIKLQAEKELKKKEENILEKQKNEKRKKDIAYALCVENAEDNYWRYMELNGTGKRDDKKGVNAYQETWDVADKNKQQDIQNCFNQHKK